MGLPLDLIIPYGRLHQPDIERRLVDQRKPRALPDRCYSPWEMEGGVGYVKTRAYIIMSAMLVPQWCFEEVK